MIIPHSPNSNRALVHPTCYTLLLPAQPTFQFPNLKKLASEAPRLAELAGGRWGWTVQEIGSDKRDAFFPAGENVGEGMEPALFHALSTPHLPRPIQWDEDFKERYIWVAPHIKPGKSIKNEPGIMAVRYMAEAKPR
jgi:hypothetical protein